MALECAAPAKINLALHVTGQRPDGYHLLETLVVFTDHGDRLIVEPAEDDSFAAAGPFSAHVPSDESNLVLRARDLLRRHFGGGAAAPVALTLEKNLPVAAGIGGGSSDAAAALSLLARHWSLDAGRETLTGIALELGADVPMCLRARPLLARGIGEAVETLPTVPALPMLLANPGRPLTTPSVFRSLMSRRNPPLPAFRCESAAELVEWLHTTRNDLEAPALSLLPEIGGVLGQIRSEGALIARMSGSGATCFGIFQTDESAERAKASIAARNPGWFVSATATLASAPELGHA